jgi:hypothetical protein
LKSLKSEEGAVALPMAKKKGKRYNVGRTCRGALAGKNRTKERPKKRPRMSVESEGPRWRV